MTVILLCQGDDVAKKRLRGAIIARYGQNPIPVESVRLGFKGRKKISLKSIRIHAHILAQATFKFPDYLRWDTVAKPMHFPLERHHESFDGKTYYQYRSTGRKMKSQDLHYVSSMRMQAWLMAALFLTPLNHKHIKLEVAGASGIEVTNMRLNTSAKIFLNEDYTINNIEVDCFNPDTYLLEMLHIDVSREMLIMNDFPFPRRLKGYWNHRQHFDYETQMVDTVTQIPTAHFALDAKMSSAAGD